MSGLSDEQMLDVRRGKPDDPGHAALVRFTRGVMETKGFVGGEEIDAFRSAGYSDAHVGEVIALIAQKTLSNYFNNVNETELDFPKAPEL
jgi:alkylhydroperoxidase family enzyme